MSNKKLRVVAISGSSGFIGSSLKKYLSSSGMKVVPLYQKEFNQFNMYGNKPSIDEYANFLKKHKIHSIIHCAAAIDAKISKEYYHSINALLTKNLYYVSKRLSIEKFIFLSTIKCQNDSFKNDHYSLSKLAAEKILIKESGKKNNPQIKILRLPPIAGKKSGGNISKISKVFKLNLPIIISKSAKENKKSFLTIECLSEIIQKLLLGKLSGSFLSLCEGDDLSTHELLENLKKQETSKSKIIFVNKSIFEPVKKLSPKIYESLFGDLYFVEDSIFKILRIHY